MNPKMHFIFDILLYEHAFRAFQLIRKHILKKNRLHVFPKPKLLQPIIHLNGNERCDEKKITKRSAFP